MEQLIRPFIRFARAVDVLDIFAFLGLALLMGGLAMVSIPAALIVPGTMLLSYTGLVIWRTRFPRRPGAGR